MLCSTILVQHNRQGWEGHRLLESLYNSKDIQVKLHSTYSHIIQEEVSDILVNNQLSNHKKMLLQTRHTFTDEEGCIVTTKTSELL